MGVTGGFVENQSPEELEELITQIDKEIEARALEKVDAKESSHCAGMFEGYYADSELVYTTSRIEHELKAYSTRDVYWSHDEILKIVYKEHLPDWDKHQEKYPPNIYGAKLDKMIYGDTLYEVTFGPKGHFHKRTAKGKLLSNEIDTRLLLKLLECAHSMKRQLTREKDSKPITISYSFKSLESYSDTLPYRSNYELEIKVGDLDVDLLNCSVSSTAMSSNTIVQTAPGNYNLHIEKPGSHKIYLDVKTEDGSWRHLDTKRFYVLPPK